MTEGLFGGGKYDSEVTCANLLVKCKKTTVNILTITCIFP